MVLKVKDTENGQEVRFSLQQLILIITLFVSPQLVVYTDYRLFRQDQDKKHERQEQFNCATIETLKDNNISCEKYVEYDKKQIK